MALINRMLDALGRNVSEMQDGVRSDSLARWYGDIIADVRESAPPHLADRISVTQDPILPMRFRLDMSRRVIPYFVAATERRVDSMPESTRLYFLRLMDRLGA